MEFSIITDCSSPPFFASALKILTVAWLVIVLASKRSAPLAAALVPVALNAASAWLGIARVIRGMALSGGGRLSLAAGLAEPDGDLLFGVVAGIVTITFLLAVAFYRRSESVPTPRHRSTLLLCGAGIALGVAGMLRATDVTLAGARTIAAAMLAIAVILAIIALLRRTEPPAWRWHLRALSIALLLHVVGAAAVWIAMQHLMSIARGE
ncbi:MAG TPA: hypothetical protein VN181_06795 [Thermoanaerobaculia bacterium]|nr:hypothetical protein [Thermoanaerobaculia bacterium]